MVVVSLLYILGCGGSEGEPGQDPGPSGVELPVPVPEAEPAAEEGAPNLCPSPQPATVTVSLGQSEAVLAQLYPVATRLPDAYTAPTRPDGKVVVPQTLKASIELFTRSSLEADQFTAISVEADPAAATVEITATGCHLADYRTQLPAFLEAGVSGLDGWNRCLKAGAPCEGMDSPHPCASKPGDTCIPWVFFLPLGQPLVNHWGVMFLNYPPADALCAADYQSNFTMARWREVLAWGANPTISWSGIVDVHPIAAYGANESAAINQTTPYFKDYGEKLLSVVTQPANLASRRGYGPGYTLPVMVSGSPAHAAWSDIVGTRVKTLDMGKTKKLASGASTAWVASSHPDVATYSCCEGDRSQSCCDGDYTSGDCKKNASGYAWSWGLAKDEVSDFTMACYFYNTSLEPSQSLDAFALTCMNGLQWGKDALCVQGRQDYQFDSAGHCNCRKAAELFCASNGADTCPSTTDLVSCAAFNQQAGCPERSPSDDVQCAVQ